MNILYSKINSLTAYSIKEANVGKLVNMISADLNLIDMKFFLVVNIMMAPAFLVMLVIVLYFG
jgi:ATP-binding cassette subfamily C (CFTR/MRP) protein 4